MALAQEDFKEIEGFLYENMARILADQSLAKPPVVYEIELRERMVRVEEELKNQRELMKEQFRLSDKRFEEMLVNMNIRFEQVDKRFEEMQASMDKRFEEMQTNMNIRFEQVDKRFEDINTRFKMMFSFMTLGFTILAVMMTVFRFLN